MNRLPLHLQFLTNAQWQGHTALTDSNRHLSYGELRESIVAAAHWLRSLGATTIAMRSDNSCDWAIVDLACQVADVCCVPLPAFFSATQTAHCLQACAADWLLTDDQIDGECQTSEILPTLRAVPLQGGSNTPVLPEGTAKITFTSGSTGTPKGVCLSTRHQWLVAQSLADSIAIPAPRHLCLLPLATLLENIGGLYTPLLCGGTVVLPDAVSRGLSGSSDLDISALITSLGQHQPGSLILIPQLLSALVSACENGWKAPPALQFIAVGGARVAPELINRARNLGLPAFEGYGLSECGSVVALNTPARDKPGSAGHILPHCKVTTENGELVIHAPCHLGYLQEPDSWYPTAVRSGDLASLDSDGYLSIQGRSKNLLITSFGRNVSPEWVESVLLAKPLLSHLVVLGDDKPALCALLSAPPQIDDAQIQGWIDHCNAQLPDYARVRHWLRLDGADWSPLMTANGRPRRAQITERYREIVDKFYLTEASPESALKAAS